ncbi:SEC-C domain-containing protein [Rhizobium leguminosarum]|uniref:SEC-C domain-containing protein n=1 Tax=Rhizobium leguminosarum TaxID=384 RepID=UPI001C97A8B3|nr:SEC-C domain-containing protein [Rhizobium leguminosarum]MBY5810508.1 SEC-C domain-containing protein [Rhizobium leguminosarum]
MPRKTKGEKCEIRSEELCPCGSGAKYKYCHKKTAKRFFRYDNGDVVAEVPLSPELVKQLKESAQRFKKIFGRAPYKSDPVFWDRAEIKETTFLKRTKKVMRAAKIPEELIFAYERTGLMISSESPAVSPFEKKEFLDAVSEYIQLEQEGIDPFYIFTYLDPRQYKSLIKIKTIIKEISIVCNLTINYTVKSIKIKDEYDKKIYILSSFRSALQSIEFISEVINDVYRDECLIISREIIEHYLRIKSLRLENIDTKAILHETFASRGLLEYAIRPNGKTDYNKVISYDGQPVEIGYTYSSLAKRTGDPRDILLYEHMYRALSNFVHRDASDRIISALRKEDLASVIADLDDDEIAGTYICAKIIFYYLDEFLKNDWIDKKTAKDIKRKLDQLSPHIDILGSNLEIKELGF